MLGLQYCSPSIGPFQRVLFKVKYRQLLDVWDYIFSPSQETFFHHHTRSLKVCEKLRETLVAISKKISSVYYGRTY